MNAPVRFDEWSSVADSPTAVPFELAPKGSVFRGMKDLDEAKVYADSVSSFFAEHGCANTTVFVVEGPTTTSKSAFEVVDASCGYRIRHRTEVAPVSPAAPEAPSPEVQPAVAAEPARRRMLP